MKDVSAEEGLMHPFFLPLEALVNHFIHRDYTVMGGEVHSDRRNPILADVMAQLDYRR